MALISCICELFTAKVWNNEKNDVNFLELSYLPRP